MLTRLVQGEPGGERLTEDELLHNGIFILNAGHETTTHLIANGLVTLCAWPGERARLIADPALMRSAVEEMLRFESSNPLGHGMSVREVELGGLRLAAGTSVTIGIGAANPDPAQIPDPDRFDVGWQPSRILRSPSASTSAPACPSPAPKAASPSAASSRVSRATRSTAGRSAPGAHASAGSCRCPAFWRRSGHSLSRAAPSPAASARGRLTTLQP